MKHILIKTKDGGLWQMGLQVVGVRRKSDGAEAALSTDKQSQQQGTLLDKNGTFHIRVTMSGEWGSLNGVMTLPTEDYDRGIPPAGWEFIYPSVEDEIAKWTPEQQAKVASWREVPYEGIPWIPGMRNTDKTFRDAWEDTTPEPKVDVNMDKARAIHMNRIRKVRDAQLTALDKDWNRAAGRKQSAQADAIEAQRETLRNLPQTFDLTAAKTPSELNAMWPAELGPRPAKI